MNPENCVFLVTACLENATDNNQPILLILVCNSYELRAIIRLFNFSCLFAITS